MAAQQGGGQQADNSMAYLWILFALFGAGFAIWYFFRKYVVMVILKIKYYELLPISLFSDKPHALMQWIAHASPDKVTFTQLAQVLQLAGNFFAIPIAVLFFIFALYIYFGNPTRFFTGSYDMKRLAKEESVNWPQIGPVTKMNLIKEDLDKGPWAMCLRPMDFAKKYDLLNEVLLPLEEGKLKREKKVGVEVDEGKANKIFASQLGRPFTTIKALPIHVRALFAITAARGNRDRANADKLLKQIAESSCGDGKLNFNGVDDVINKHKNARLIKMVLERHGYVLTMMASMLELGRTDGVLASAEFLWLKPIDRKLWYMLNNVGRQTSFTEVAGPMAHWLAEKELSRKIVTPMVNEATKALVGAIKEVEYKPDHKEDEAEE